MIVIARNRPSTSPANVEPLSGSHQCMRLSPRLVHLAAKLKSAVLVSLPATVTLAVCVPYFSCHASIVYVPGGRPLIAKLPSPPLAPKNGWGSTPSQACIHPCTLHSSATMTSGLSNVFVEVITAGWLMLKGRLAFAFALHLGSSVMSIFGMAGLAPVNFTLPLMVPPPCAGGAGWRVHAARASASTAPVAPTAPSFRILPPR